MPDKPFTILTYAASASLAAIALVYFFTPASLLDGAGSSTTARKRGIVGLANPMNDCFINAVLQALAGLGDLRLYLVRELYRRRVAHPHIYRVLPELSNDGDKTVSPAKLLSLQRGEVTQGFKDMIDRLNERPAGRKTISANPFITVLEHAFGTRISKAQQDAQELLQVVAERLCEEYHAGREARKRAREAPHVPHKAASREPLRKATTGIEDEEENSANERTDKAVGNAQDVDLEDETGFPLEGRTQAQIECQHCHFIPKSTPMSFVMLTLAVPQRNSTTLSECFDAHFKAEVIDDYKCDRCRLEHALGLYQAELRKAATDSLRRQYGRRIEALEHALATDPETPPAHVVLPDIRHAPMRRISRHVAITDFPKVLIIHLSRSIFSHPYSSSAKNTAKVSFPERLPLGGLLHRTTYRLLGVVTHRGTHHSGHYEAFRRQEAYAPPPEPPNDNLAASDIRPSTTETLPSAAAAESRQPPRPHSEPAESRTPTADVSTPGGSSRVTTATTASLPSSDPQPSDPSLSTKPSSISLNSSMSRADAPSELSPSTAARSSGVPSPSIDTQSIPPGQASPSVHDPSSPRTSTSQREPSTPTRTFVLEQPASPKSLHARLSGFSGRRRKAKGNSNGNGETAQSPPVVSPGVSSSAASSSVGGQVGGPVASSSIELSVSADSISNTDTAQAARTSMEGKTDGKSNVASAHGKGKKHTKHRPAETQRWWRISDEKVRECKTSEVLGMQKEVYLLFYEMEH